MCLKIFGWLWFWFNGGKERIMMGFSVIGMDVCRVDVCLLRCGFLICVDVCGCWCSWSW